MRLVRYAARRLARQAFLDALCDAGTDTLRQCSTRADLAEWLQSVGVPAGWVLDSLDHLRLHWAAGGTALRAQVVGDQDGEWSDAWLESVLDSYLVQPDTQVVIPDGSAIADDRWYEETEADAAHLNPLAANPAVETREHFLARAARHYEVRAWLLRADVGCEPRRDLPDLARNAAWAVAHRVNGQSYRQIARAARVEPEAVRKAVTRFWALLDECPASDKSDY